MSKIKFTNTTIVETKRATPDKNGNYKIDRHQAGLWEKSNGEVIMLDIPIPENTSAYAPGYYEFQLEDIIQKGRFGRLEVVPFYDLRLTPVVASTEKPLFSKKA